MRLIIIGIFTLAFGCIPYSFLPINNKIESAIPSKRGDKIIFEKEDKDGFLLPDTLIVFNTHLDSIGTIIIPVVERVKILAITKQQYSLLRHDTDECYMGNYLEVLYKNKHLILFGRYVYKIEGQQKIKANGNTYEFYASIRYSLGAVDSIGLSGCDDFSLITIRKLPDDDYSLIKDPYKYDRFKYYALKHDDGEFDTINNIFSEKDTIIVSVGAKYQTGTGKYLLKFVYAKDICPAIITNWIIYTGGSNYMQPDIK